jgi:hypothetical protein
MMFVAVISLLAGAGVVAETESFRFTGDSNSEAPSFTVEGPWILDWALRSEFPILANFELRLFDSESGEFIGTVAQLEGTGAGLKLFDDGGSFRLEVVAGNVEWEIEVTEVTRAQAGKMERSAKGKPSFEDTSRTMLRRVREGSFDEWRPVDDETLLLFSDDGLGWRATLAAACPGLASASAISFVAPITKGADEYDSILLDDGTRCYFEHVSLLAVE